jgi:signal transduction histidine kinase
MAIGKPADCAVKLQRAGKLLHDEIGPLLSAAGLRLQLIKMDFPETAGMVQEVTETLDAAIDRVRDVSRELGSHEDGSAERPSARAKARGARRTARP